MTATTPEPVVSGVPYAVLDVDGREPRELAEFTGEVRFALAGKTGRHEVVGLGQELDGHVRFHQKATPGGKDVRVWSVRAVDGGGFVASAD